jgi:hypothetical protein
MTLKREILNLFNIIAVPTEVYNDINATPRWRMPAALLFIISPMIGFFIIPAAIEPLRKIYEESFDTRTAEIALQTSTHYFTIINVAFEPLIKIVRWVILSAAIFFPVFLYYRNASFNYTKAFAVVAYGEILFHLMGILTILIVYTRGINQVTDSSDLVIFKGINYLFDKNVLTSSCNNSLSNVNPFSLWYIAMTSRGIQITANIRYLSSLIFVTIGWCIWMTVLLGESFVADKVFALFS